MEKNEGRAACCVGFVVCTILITIGVVYGSMMKVVNYDEWGIAHINNVIVDEGTIYTPGRYNIGFRQEFKVFKSTIHVVSFGEGGCANNYGMPCFAKSELLLIPKQNPNPIPTKASLQFTLRKDGLVALYKKYKMNYVNKLDRIITQQLKYVAQNYEVADYYNSRSTVVKAMADKIEEKLKENGIDMLAFQVSHFQLPASQKRTMQNVVLQQYAVKVAQQQGEVNKAKAYSERVLLEQGAKVETFQIVIEQALNLKLATIRAEENLITAETKRMTEEIMNKNTTAKTIYEKGTANMIQKVRVNTSTAMEETNVQRKIIKAANDTRRRSYEQTTQMLDVTILANLTRVEEQSKQEVAKIKNKQAKWATLYSQETENKRLAINRAEAKIHAETLRQLAGIQIEITKKRSIVDAKISAVTSSAKAKEIVVTQAAAARSMQMKANATRAIYHEMAAEMNFDGRDLLLLQYVESMRVSLANKAGKGAQIYMDVTTPSLFKDAKTKMIEV